MGCLIKLVVTIIPLIMASLGIYWSIQGVNYWIEVSQASVSTPRNLVIAGVDEYSATAYVPTSIKPETIPVEFEVVVKHGTRITETAEVAVALDSECDYLRLDKRLSMMQFSPDSEEERSLIASITTRNITPPTSCNINVAMIMQADTYSFPFTIPIDAFSGRLQAIVQVLFGVVAGILGLLATVRTILS